MGRAGGDDAYPWVEDSLTPTLRPDLKPPLTSCSPGTGVEVRVGVGPGVLVGVGVAVEPPPPAWR